MKNLKLNTMQKGIIEDSVAKSSIDKDTFRKLVANYDLEPIRFDIKQKQFYMDEAGMLRRMWPVGSGLTLKYIGGHNADMYPYVLLLKIVDQDGEKDIFRDVLTRKLSDAFQEEHTLPDVDHSNVARKLASLGIKGPFEYYATINVERATLDTRGEQGVRIFLDKLQFDGMGNEEYALRVCTTEEGVEDRCEDILLSILKPLGAEIIPQKSKMQRLFDFVDAREKK